LNGISTGSVPKHAIASNLDIEYMFFAIPKCIGEHVLDAFAASSESLDRLAVGGPDEALTVCVPVELEAFLLEHALGDRKTDPEPVG
jgi:hypothetical protein